MEGPGKRTTAVVPTAAELKQFSWENLSMRAYISVADAGKVNSALAYRDSVCRAGPRQV